MGKRFAVITIHGMGETPTNYWEPLVDNLKDRLGIDVWKNIHFDNIYYQDKLQPNQYRTWHSFDADQLDYKALRKFMLYGFSDAAGMEIKPHDPDSPYLHAQTKIRECLLRCLEALDNVTNKRVVIFAHSLGCQVLSNYIWDSDSQQSKGIWAFDPLEGLGTEEIDFLKLKTKRYLFTTGCNIPIFVAGLNEIVAISKSPDDFEWINYFDRDDILGWPLKVLSESYDSVVLEDYQINSGGIFGGMTPLSHNYYWEDDDFLGPAADSIVDLYHNAE